MSDELLISWWMPMTIFSLCVLCNCFLLINFIHVSFLVTSFLLKYLTTWCSLHQLSGSPFYLQLSALICAHVSVQYVNMDMNLYLPQAHLTIYQKGAYYSGITFFNNISSEIKNVAGNQKKFKIALKKFWYTYSFYTLEEYFSQLWINP